MSSVSSGRYNAVRLRCASKCLVCCFGNGAEDPLLEEKAGLARGRPH